jgi:catechol 2,3-dioxygenase-like lactoylglutathione lyase family enzyme
MQGTGMKPSAACLLPAMTRPAVRPFAPPADARPGGDEMIDHLSFGVADLDRSGRFYDSALGALGYRRHGADADALWYGADQPVLWLLKTARPVVADDESGLHLSFSAKSPEAVQAFYRAALANGGRDNGKPGIRTEYSPNYYAAFVYDPDGYRVEANCHVPVTGQ